MNGSTWFLLWVHRGSRLSVDCAALPRQLLEKQPTCRCKWSKRQGSLAAADHLDSTAVKFADQTQKPRRGSPLRGPFGVAERAGAADSYSYLNAWIGSSTAARLAGHTPTTIRRAPRTR